MAATSFDDLVRREQEALKGLGTRQAEKDEWLRSLDDLYDQLAGYLKTYVEQGQVSISFSPIELEEEYVGRYTAEKMIIDIGTKRVELQPVGTFLIGSKGRVDVISSVGRARILLVNSRWKSLNESVRVSVSTNGAPVSSSSAANAAEVTWAWRIVTRPPAREIVEISKETFLNLLVEVSDGKDL